MNELVTIERAEDTGCCGAAPCSASWHVFQVNDCDWWMARTLEEAKSAALAEYGGDEETIDDPRQLSEEELERIEYFDEFHRAKHSFKVELGCRIAAGPKVEMFATTEY